MVIELLWARRPAERLLTMSSPFLDLIFIPVFNESVTEGNEFEIKYLELI